MTDFIHGHVHALDVIVYIVVTEASRLVLMTHEETQVIRFCSCAQGHVYRAKVTADVKANGGCSHGLLILAKGDISRSGR